MGGVSDAGVANIQEGSWLMMGVALYSYVGKVGRQTSTVRAVWMLTAICFFYMVPAPFAQTVSLKDVFSLALKNDPRFVGMGYERAAQEEILKQAWAEVKPNLAAEGVYTETDQEIVSSDNTVYGTGSSSYPTKEYSLSFVQPLFNMASFVNIKKAKAQLAVADAELQAARQELAIRVAAAYFSVLEAGDRMAATVAEEAAVKRHYELIKGRFDSGLSTRTEFYDAKARLAEVMANRIAAASDLDNARQALEEIVGPVAGKLASLRDKIPMIPPDPSDPKVWIKAAHKQNPELKAAGQKVESARNEVMRQKAGHYPYLALEANYTWRDTEGTLFGGGSEVKTNDILVRMTVPLYAGGSVSSRTREARYRLDASLQEETRQMRAIERKVWVAYHGVNTAIERAKSFREALEAQKLALEGKKEGYRSGLFTILAVLDAERDLSLARQNYAMARYDYILNSLMLKRAAGTLDDQDITIVDSWLQSDSQGNPVEPVSQRDVEPDNRNKDIQNKDLPE